MSSTEDPEVTAALEAIAQGPGDDSLKRVLGDLLLERGDPRGEFLLCQFLIAENQASSAVRSRADELWRVHKREWLAGLASLLEDVELQFGFPVGATLRHHVRPPQVLEAVRAPLFATLRRLRGTLEGGGVVEALASPRLRRLEAVALRAEEDLIATAERGVPGRLTSLELELPLRRDAVQLMLTSPAFSSLRRLVARATEASLYSRYTRGLSRGEVVSLPPLVESLGAHPALRQLTFGGLAFGDPDPFFELAPLWPRLPRLERLEVPGCFELTRDADGEALLLQNFDAPQLRALRPAVPAGVRRVRLMPKHTREPLDRAALLAVFAGLDPKIVP